MWAIGFVNLGKGGMVNYGGNDCIQKINYKSIKYIMMATEGIRRNNDEVWLIPDLTQEMCEARTAKFYDMVISVGKRIK